MKKAVIVFAHNLPEQLNLFAKQLISDGTTDVFIHVSRKNEEIKNQIKTNEHIMVSDKNITTTWGSDELLKAILIMLETVLSSPIEYEYVLICSGQDLLVRKGLDSFLEENKGKAFIEGWADDKRRRAFLLYKWPSKYRQLINNYSYTRVKRRIRIALFKHGFPLCRKKVDYDTSKMTFYQSYFWSVLPRDVASYLLKVSKDPSFMSIFEGGLTAEEGFTLTVLMNSDYSNRVEFINNKTKSLTFTKPFLNNHPPIIDMNDVSAIKESGAFFARKFDLRSQKEVVDYFVNLFLT